MQNIRLVLADDHGILREGLRLLLEGQHDIEVVAEAADGIDALEKVRNHRPDVLLLDIAMPGINGLEAIEVLKGISPKTQIVVLSRFEKEAYVHKALEAGARGYVVKGAPGSELVEAIRSVRLGRYFLSHQIQTEVIRSYLRNRGKPPSPNGGFSSLSEREVQVFRLLIEGNSSHQISDMLCISSKTVDKHRSNIARKIGIENPVKMLQFAIRNGLVDPAIWRE